MHLHHIFWFLLKTFSPAILAQGNGDRWRHRTSSPVTSTPQAQAEQAATLQAQTQQSASPSASNAPSSPPPSSPPPSSGGVHKGFNYGADTNGGATDFATEFAGAQKLTGTSGFNSARLYTMIEYGTTDTPSSAFQAAINTGTSLLLGIWCSGGQTVVTNELNALAAAVKQYPKLNGLFFGISVGS